MISQELREVVRRTTEHAIQCNDDADHTVAAGLLLESGSVVLGLNTYHFLGGPCGEVAALSQHAATAAQDPIRGVVAVDGSTGRLIPPCGKCRQVFFDLDPNIQFVVRDANGLITRTAAKLLPFSYNWRDANAVQEIYMWEGYEQAIRSGKKTQTIRVDDPFTIGQAQVVFEKSDGAVVQLAAQVLDIRTVSRSELSEEDAVRDGFANLEELNQVLNRHYPGLGPEESVDVVSFALTGPAQLPAAT